MSAPLFIIGAGFNVDATAEAGRVPLSSTYPLVGQLAEICFGLTAMPLGKSVEQLFHEAISSGNRAPIDRLYGALMQADYFVAERLSASHSHNSYLTFLEQFPASHFLTFNYDSLIEILLFALSRWRPDDGYGVAVQTRFETEGVPVPARSENLVLHLHGSLCVYPSDFSVRWTSSGRSHTDVLEHRETPLFVFDPDNVAHRFFPYGRVRPSLTESHRPLNQRVLAPVPDKAEGLGRSFIRAVHARAGELASAAGRVVSIGYSFNPKDQASYGDLLRTLASRNAAVTLVSPDAAQIKPRLVREYPGITWIPLPHTFRRWVSEGFSGAGD